MADILNDAGLDLLFRKAHTARTWIERPVSDVLLQALYDLLRWAPTSYNSSPARILFLKSKAAKERLAPALSAGNRDQTMAAPVTAIVAYDTRFYEFLPKLYPGNPNAKSSFVGKPEAAERAAFRSGTLQGGYMILAARALGLDCGPMSGFDNAAVDREFFPDGRLKSNFLCNLGYADPAGMRPRNPRLDFDDACRIL
jgi:3-hydroxypropanoate dehydrogenase